MSVVQPEKGGEVRVMHRNHLLPAGEGLIAKRKEAPKAEKVRKVKKKHASDVKEPDKSTSESSSEEEEGGQGVRRSGRQKRGREVLNYGRLGSPAYVNMSNMVLHALLSVVCAVLGEGSVPAEETGQPSGDGSNVLNPGGEHP